MRTLYANVAGWDRPIYVAETPQDVAEVERQVMVEDGPLALDVETTGLQVYRAGFRVRTLQLGTKEMAWVLPVEALPSAGTAAIRILRDFPSFVAHNASFDIRALIRAGYAFPGDLWAKTNDTFLMAHLLDPREKADGGSGQSLEDLSASYFDSAAEQYKTALLDRFRELGLKRVEGYSSIPLDEEAFLRYAGVDVLLTSWLFEALSPLVEARGFSTLLEYELALSRICGEMMDRGVLVDVDYLERLGPELTAEAEEAEKVARDYGVENVNSGRQVGEALEALGAPLEARTKTGQWKTDKEVLEGLMASEGPWSPLAEAVMVAKRRNGDRTKYVDKVLEARDPFDRVHADIRSLKARTARMAVANPPLQQLPSGDWKIRRGFVAKPGHVIVAADLDQVELRVLAALSEEQRMKKAIQEGQDLHQVTADGAKTSRRIGKMANFLMVYGGGAGKLARSAGIPMAEAKRVVSGYHRTFPGVKRFSRKIQQKADYGRRWVTTPTGRVLPMDRDRSYAGLNYLIQSTARDVLGQALLRMDEDGVGRYVVLVVHDEVIAEVPEAEAEVVAKRLGELMTFPNFLGSGIDLTASGEVYGPSWGHGYGYEGT